MALLELEGITKNYGSLTAVDKLNLVVKDGEMIALLGESGCGKTTTLRMVAGFIQPDEGVIKVDGHVVNDIPAYKRNIGIFFQNYALFPHMTAFENIAYGLKIKKMDKVAIEKEVAGMMKLVGLEGLGCRYPKQLSGGQQQRVALARSLVVKPSILLLDEPLSNLDAKLRVNMQTEIKRIQRLLGITTIIVTHDQQEAISLADKVVVMRKGKIIQENLPREVYEKPTNPFVADFMGFENFIPVRIGRIDNNVVAVEIHNLEKSIDIDRCQCFDVREGEDAYMAVRPEKIRLVSPSAEHAVVGTVGNIIYKGNYYHVEVEGIFSKPIILHVNEFNGKTGDRTGVLLVSDELRIYKKFQ
ncbi:MAG: ABC transporter ATP-binding protein [Spirochaetia bacterium]|jgi:ABC-type Fe3+/spermidine/putrescine transport system ATPase subunit|nr:ABC transporter ATP-binding protein [Spirochaetia bacterium]